MRIIVALLALMLAAPALAQTVTLGDATVSMVFYVKEGTNSPYQGLIQMTPAEYAAIKPAELQKRQMDQFNAWKAATEAAKNAPVIEESADEKVSRVKALRAEADAIAADPAVAAKLGVK